MNRRALLASIGAGATASVGGCLGLGGSVVLETRETVRLPPHSRWTEEIDDVGSASLSYTVRSDDDRFQVLYFREGTAYKQYQAYTAGDDAGDSEATGSGPASPDVPLGHDHLSRIAIRNNERGTYETVVPMDGGRYSIDVDGTHYFVVDYSNYGVGMEVTEAADPIQATVALEVVEDGPL